MSLYNKHLFDKDPPAGFDGLFEWDYLIPAFQKATGRGIQPMDIDAHIEIGGQHLIFETKAKGVKIPGGQKKALLQLWAKGYHTVIFLWGKSDPMRVEIYWPNGRKSVKREGVTKKDIYDICYKWSLWADKNKCPFQYSGENDQRK